MARKLAFNSDNVDVLNVMYDAITKHEDSGGVAGLRKITKILDLIDEIATLGEKDIYTLKNAGDDKGYSYLYLDDDQYNFIKSCFDKVKWHPMKSKLITKAYDYLESIKESKIEAVKSDNPPATSK